MAYNSAFKGFYKRSQDERWRIIQEEYPSLKVDELDLPSEVANQMIENYMLNYELPLGLAVNFTINHKEYVIPMVVEEPSVIAAASNGAKQFDNIETNYGVREITGQIILYDIDNVDKAEQVILDHRASLIELAKQAAPSMVERGGGPKQITVERKQDQTTEYIVVYLTLNPMEAMGANVMNTVLEAITPQVEELTNGTALMSILSNYSQTAVASVSVSKPIAELAEDLEVAKEVAHRLVLASNYAQLDVYRATTHNKGIMNGIDAVAIATGNDWRAIEASAHAFASREGNYQGLTRWTIDEKDQTVRGYLEIPIPIATVGGTLGIHPIAQWSLNILQKPNSQELAQIMAAVGLIQNYSALKALVTEGIQKGHMGLQARSLAIQVGATTEEVSEVVKQLKEAPLMNRSTATDILNRLRDK